MILRGALQGRSTAFGDGIFKKENIHLGVILFYFIFCAFIEVGLHFI